MPRVEHRWTTQDGRILVQTVLGGTNFSESTTHHVITVPAGKRWYHQNIVVTRDVSATLDVGVYDSNDVLIYYVAQVAAGADTRNITTSTLRHMQAGDYIDFVFGVAQTAAARITISYLELDV